MKKDKANPAVVGAFVVFCGMLTVFMLLFVNSTRWFSKKEEFVSYFPDSVNGLTLGANVKFKGVQIGKVTDIIVNFNNKNSEFEKAFVPVVMQIDFSKIHDHQNKPLDLSDSNIFKEQLELGLSAKLQYESIVTGMLYVELDYNKKSHVRVPENFAIQHNYPMIPVADQELKVIVGEIMDFVSEIKNIDISGMSKNLATTLSLLAQKLEEIDAKKLNDEIVATLEGIQESMKIANDVREVLKTVHLKLNDIDSKALNDEAIALLKKIEKLDMEGFSATAVETMKDLQLTMGEFREILKPESSLMYRGRQALDQITKMARVMAELGEFLERNPNALITGKSQDTE